MGRAATRPILLLWYIMRSPATPRKDKLAIFASLTYLVLPIDVLDAKRLPIIGWLDEIVSVADDTKDGEIYYTGDTTKG